MIRNCHDRSFSIPNSRAARTWSNIAYFYGRTGKRCDYGLLADAVAVSDTALLADQPQFGVQPQPMPANRHRLRAAVGHRVGEH